MKAFRSDVRWQAAQQRYIDGAGNGNAAEDFASRIDAAYELHRIESAFEQQRCTPCWMAAHVACERGACACGDELHKDDGSVREHRPVKERAAISAQKAG